jgi:hypothetical protein
MRSNMKKASITVDDLTNTEAKFLESVILNQYQDSPDKPKITIKLDYSRNKNQNKPEVKDIQEGEYRATLVTRRDGTTYTTYLRCLYKEDSKGHVVFIDDSGARVGMVPKLTANMRPLFPDEQHPEIDLEFWRDK